MTEEKHIFLRKLSVVFIDAQVLRFVFERTGNLRQFFFQPCRSSLVYGTSLLNYLRDKKISGVHDPLLC